MGISFSGVMRRAALAAAVVLAVTAASAAADPLTPTTTSIDASPNPAVVDTTVTYTIEVVAAIPAGVGPATSGPTGTVSLDVAGGPIATCQLLPLVNGAATCHGPAGSAPDFRKVDADYSGDMSHAFSTGFDYLQVIGPATVIPSVTPNPVMRRAPITYKATVAGISLGGAIVPAVASFGTMAYLVDGEPIAACAAQPVNFSFNSSCPSLAPPVGGTHVLKTVYSGSHYAGPNSATTDFLVLAPAVTLPDTVDFASVTVGQSATRTVALLNSGNAALQVGGAAIKNAGSFSITADGCAEKALAPGETCDVTVAFVAGAAGPFSAKLGFSHDADDSSKSVALTGTGVTAPVPPAPTPTPPPAQPGGTLAPGAKPTLTVTVPSSGSGARSSSVPVLSLPLSCPANEECLLDGSLKVNTSTLSRSARAAAAETKTVARFSRVQVEAGGLKTIKLKLSPAFVKSAQKRGIRKIKATLTINTVLGSGQRTSTQQQVTVLLPKAAKKKQAVQKVRPRFTG